MQRFLDAANVEGLKAQILLFAELVRQVVVSINEQSLAMNARVCR
jgi:hypothetical protein